ncbi:Ldh family oxidoreductase [Citricoccus nitrophenolicus]
MECESATLLELCVAAACRAGAAPHEAKALAAATLRAEQRGRSAVGVVHFFDFLDGFASGAINGQPKAVLRRRGTWLSADADGGIPHAVFSRVLPRLVRMARRRGSAVLAIRNSYTCGELGDFTTQLAQRGLVAVGAANSPAHIAWGQKGHTVLGTNPVSLAAPLEDGAPLLIDQSASSTAYVSLRDAAASGMSIPRGWAVDANGKDTTDASAALKGALLPYAGHKGANQALMVEILAGLAGGLWSVDAPSFTNGTTSPSIGFFLLALDPDFADRHFRGRLQRHLDRLQHEHAVHIPGRGNAHTSSNQELIEVSEDHLKRLRQAAAN